MTPTPLFPTETEHFTAGYNPWLGWPLLILGALNTGLALWLMLLDGGFNSGIILGLLLTVAGYLYLNRPYFAVAPNRLTIYSPLGQVVKRYPFEHFSDILLENNRVYICTRGDRQKLRLSRWMTKPKDWRALQRIVTC